MKSIKQIIGTAALIVAVGTLVGCGTSRPGSRVSMLEIGGYHRTPTGTYEKGVNIGPSWAVGTGSEAPKPAPQVQAPPPPQPYNVFALPPGSPVPPNAVPLGQQAAPK